MLDNVALLSSMESTFGTKAADSREGGGDRCMGTIPETGREDQHTDTARTAGEHHRWNGKEVEEDEDEVDGPGFSVTEPHGTDTRGGYTLQTGMYTDTEVHDYRQALKQQAGLATMDDVGGSMFKDSHGGMSSGLVIQGAGTVGTAGMGTKSGTDGLFGGGSSEGTTAAVGSTGGGDGQSASFGHRPIAPPRTPRSNSKSQYITQIAYFIIRIFTFN